MKTKIAYVLVSSEQDVYLEQAYVSMMSLRHHNPDAHIVLVTDRLTAESFTGIRKEEVKFVDEMVVVDLPADLTAQKRSRILKTTVRSRITGNYLYIDVDTVITKPLDGIDLVESSVAACEDSHVRFLDSPYREASIEVGERLDWPIWDETTYFNGGVHFVKDDAAAHGFFELWHRNYLAGFGKGIKADQPSFALSNYQAGHLVDRLDDVWNCQLKHGMRYLKDAKVVHYLCTSLSGEGETQLFVMNEEGTYGKLKRGELDPRIVRSFDDPFEGLSRFSLALSGRDAREYTRYRIIEKKDLALMDDPLVRFSIKVAGRLRKAFPKKR